MRFHGRRHERHTIEVQFKDLAIAVVGLGMVGTILLPRRINAIQITNAMMQGQANMIRAAMGGSYISGHDDPINNRSQADLFNEQAMAAIGEFWEGFSY